MDFSVRPHSLCFNRVAGDDQGRGTLSVAKNISRLSMWEVVLFLTVNSNSGSLSLDSAVHRIIAHVRRWVVFLSSADFIHDAISPVRSAAISMKFPWSLVIPAYFMFKLVAMPLFTGSLLRAIRVPFSHFALMLCGSLGAVNQVLRHRDFDVKTYPSSSRSCRYGAGSLACRSANVILSLQLPHVCCLV